MLVRTALFANKTPKDLVFFSHVTSTWYETVKDYIPSWLKENIKTLLKQLEESLLIEKQNFIRKEIEEIHSYLNDKNSIAYTVNGNQEFFTKKLKRHEKFLEKPKLDNPHTSTKKYQQSSNTVSTIVSQLSSTCELINDFYEIENIFYNFILLSNLKAKQIIINDHHAYDDEITDYTIGEQADFTRKVGIKASASLHNALTEYITPEETSKRNIPSITPKY